MHQFCTDSALWTGSSVNPNNFREIRERKKQEKMLHLWKQSLSCKNVFYMLYAYGKNTLGRCMHLPKHYDKIHKQDSSIFFRTEIISCGVDFKKAKRGGVSMTYFQ